MKNRSDFVTNSSSSSFIIAYKDAKEAPNSTVEKLNGIAKMLLDNEAHYETDCAEYFHSIEELNDYLRDEYYDDYSLADALSIRYNHEEAEDAYSVKDVKDFLDNGYTIAIKEVSYHDELVRYLIDLLDETSEDFIVLNNFE